jgi:hypothetical protein
VWAVEFRVRLVYFRAVIMSGMLSLIEKAIQHPFVVYTPEGFISSAVELISATRQIKSTNVLPATYSSSW